MDFTERICTFGDFYQKFNPFWSANEHTEMKLKIYLSEAWMCSEFGINNTDVEQERVNDIIEKYH